MAHRTSVYFALLFALLAAGAAHADIGYAAAAEIARAARPTEPLFSIRKRTQRGETFYSTKLVQELGVNASVLKIDAESGAVRNEDTEPILPPEHLEVASVLGEIGTLGVDFAMALAAAERATGIPAATVARIDMTWEFLLLLYDVRYIDGTRVLVDGVSGMVFGNDETPQLGGTVEPNAFAGIVASACTVSGPPWVPFESELFAHPTGIGTNTLLLNPLNGRVKQVQTRAGMTEVVQFTPVGRLAEGVAELRPQLPSVAVTADEFLARLATRLPGATVASIKLDSRLRNGAQSTRWTAVVALATGDSAEYAVDATVPLGQGLVLGQLLAPRIEGDFNGDGHVLGDDLVELMAVFGEIDPVHDLDRNGTVGGSDLSLLLRNWG